MTESITPKTEGHDKTPVLLTKGKDDGRQTAAGSTSSAGRSRSAGALQTALVVVILVAIVLAGIVWFQFQTAQQSQQVVLEQLDQSTRTAAHADQLSRQLQAQVAAQASGLAQLQTTVQELQDQLANLDQAFQVLTDSGSDLILLNDIDHLVSIANQQITLGGNVANAIVALETAQARLSRANRPALASIQQTLNGDLERLRAASVVDVPALSVQLEQLNGLLAQAPLLVPDDAVPGVRRAEPQVGESPAITGFKADPEAPWWRTGLDASVYWAGQAWSMLRHDLADVISVRRVDDQSALLISPDQADQLRLTLKLRVMTAQLALMMRQSDVWKAELDAINMALQSHFDTQVSTTQRAQRLVTRLVDTPVDSRLPALTQTLSALETVRQESTRSLERRRSSSSLEEAGASGDTSRSAAPEAAASGEAGAVSTPESSPAASAPVPASAPDAVSAEQAAPASGAAPEPATAPAVQGSGSPGSPSLSSAGVVSTISAAKAAVVRG